MAERVTTLFIEDTAIRFMVARGKQAEKWASVPLEAGLVKHGLIQDKEKVAAKLKETFNSEKIGNRIIAGLSEPGSLYRIITLPRLPEAILDEAVKREAERVIPLPQSEIYLGYQIIAQRPDDMQLFLAAFSRNAVDTLTGTLKLAGLKPTSLDLVPLALCRAVDKSTAIVVSLRSSNFEIAVMVDHVPQVIRSLSLPGEAESLIDKLPTIAEELERTVSFYNSGHTDKPLDSTVPVFVDGELANAQDTWPSLVGNLGSTVTPLPSLIQAASDFDPGQYTVNIGLALKENEREAGGTIVNFNALPRSFRPEKPKFSRIMIPIGAGVGALVLVFLALQTAAISSDVNNTKSETALAQGRVTQQNTDVTNLKKQVTDVQAKAEPLQNQIKAISSDRDTFDNLTGTLTERRDQVNTATSRIVSILPASMSINNLNFTDSISVTGSAIVDADVFAFARKLMDTGLFKSVTLNSISLNSDNGYDFGLNIVPK